MNIKDAKSRLKTGILVTGMIFALHLVFGRFAGKNPDEQLHLPFNAWLSGLLGNENALNPRIKIVTWKDSEAQNFQPPALGFEAWQSLLNTLAASSAQRILVAADFAEATWKRLNLNKLGGKFVFSSRVVPQGHYEGRLNLGHSVTPGTNDKILLGPHESFGRKVGYGHIGPWSEFKAWPMIRTDLVGEGEWSKNLALSGGAPASVTDHIFNSGDRKVALNDDGSVYVLPVNKASLDAATIDFQEVLTKPTEFVNSIQGSDIVLVQEKDLWHESKGITAELAQLAGFASQQLNNDWLTISSGPGFFVPLALFTAVAAFLLSPVFFSTTVPPTLLFVSLSGPILFSTAHVLIPWSQTLFILFPAALVGGLFGSMTAWMQRRLYESQFTISFGPAQSHQIAKHFENESFETEEKLLTLVDIDIVGFSKTIENTSPQETAKQISDFLNSIIDSVHSFGGFVADVTPDGVLAVFGHGIGKPSKTNSRNQVTQSILCARQIQAQCVAQIRDFNSSVMPPFPVRIALNTSTVRIGLLELQGRQECKVIGAGVDLVRQLAAHCEPFRILVSSSSFEFLKNEKGSQLEKWSVARASRLGDSKEWLATYEFNPFDHDPEQLKQATEIYRSYNKIKREDNRFAFEKGQEPYLQTEVGRFEILDFSLSGLRVRAQDFLAVGAVIDAWPAEFRAQDAPFRASLTVHWGVPDKKKRDTFVLGMRYTSASEAELQNIFSYFHNKLARVHADMQTADDATQEQQEKPMQSLDAKNPELEVPTKKISAG